MNWKWLKRTIHVNESQHKMFRKFSFNLHVIFFRYILLQLHVYFFKILILTK